MTASSARRVVAAAARGLACGLTGTAVMTFTASRYARLRGATDRIIDYDTSEHVVIAAATVLRVRPRGDRERRALFHLIHWGYGTAVGIAYEAITHAVPARPAATATFFTGCQAMAFVLFPLLGRTPPPWRWQADVIAISLLQHAVYAATVDLTHRALRHGDGNVPSRSSLAGSPGPDFPVYPRRVLTWAGQGLRAPSPSKKTDPSRHTNGTGANVRVSATFPGRPEGRGISAAGIQ
jgi:hypothetical protein